MRVNPEEGGALLENHQSLPDLGSKRDLTGEQGIEMTSMRQPSQSMSRLRLKQSEMKNKNRIRELRELLEGKFVTTVMTLVTVFALVGDDIRLWVTQKDSDDYFFASLILSFWLFSLELILNTVVVEEFKYSFFFWLDIIATLSLIPDIPWITDYLGLLIGQVPSFESMDATIGSTAGQTQGLSSEMEKVIKSVRLIRLIRIIKIYKYIVQQKGKEDTDERGSRRRHKKREKKITATEEPEETLFKRETDPSKLGKALQDTINRKTIIGVLLMLMILPLLTRSDVDYSTDYGLRELFWFGRSSCQDPDGFFCKDQKTWVTEEGWKELLRGYNKSAFNAEQVFMKELLWLHIPNFQKQGAMESIAEIEASSFDPEFITWQESPECSGFNVSSECPWRFEEMELVSYTPQECIDNPLILGCDQLVAFARFQKQIETQMEARLQFLTTLFTCVVLTVASLTFSIDIDQIVVEPIKKIVDIIQKLAEGPLKKPEPVKPEQTSDLASQMKTKMLEKTIFKIGTLLQQGFGEKGATIVSRTLTYDERFMELQIPGKKVNMVFSVCQIRQFSETTEQLLEEIIVFVNKIVKIVHECGNRWGGVPSNNYGDRYILTWRLPVYQSEQAKLRPSDSARNLSMQDGGDGALSSLNVDTKSQWPELPYAPWWKEDIDEFEDLTQEEIKRTREEIADKALISAVKTVAELGRAPDLQAYSRHPRILPKFGQNYKTQITFGMHVGQAIEGSIGTDQKVDALFLSADAAIAQRIESLNENYSTTILMTGDLYELLSDPGQQSLRQVDQVYIRESGNLPQEVWSFDMKPIEPLAVTNDEDEDETQAMANEKAPREIGGFIKYEEDSEEEDESPGLNQKEMPFIEKVYTMDHDFVCISKQRNDEFENLYAKGLESYITGDWIGAQMAFTMCADKVDKLIGDGPLNHMRDLMEKSKAMPPDDWKQGFDWDKKPEPPDDIFPMGEEDSESELQGE